MSAKNLAYHVDSRRIDMRVLGSKVNSSRNARKSRRQGELLAVSEDRISAEVEIDSPEESEEYSDTDDDLPSVSITLTHCGETGGLPGFLSFYNRPYKRENETIAPVFQRSDSSISWLVGPAVLVASFILPSLYLRKIISIVFEDSLLTGILLNVLQFLGVICIWSLSSFIMRFFPHVVVVER